jgi:hypothetical protein
MRFLNDIKIYRMMIDDVYTLKNISQKSKIYKILKFLEHKQELAKF